MSEISNKGHKIAPCELLIMWINYSINKLYYLTKQAGLTMRKCIILLFLYLASNCYAQIDWLPLQLGNEYQYSCGDQGYQFYVFGRITKDTIVNNKTYFDFSPVCSILQSFLREDSLGNVYALNLFGIDTSFIQQPEYLIAPYNSQENDIWLIAKNKSDSSRNIYGTCFNYDSSMENGKTLHIKYMYLEPNYGYLLFGEGVGITGWGMLDNGFFLNYAKVGDRVFGQYVGINENKQSVTAYRLFQNYPNPFNPSTSIDYQIKQSGLVTIKVYDMLGNEVRTLVNEYKQAGSYSLNFNAGNLSSGVYLYRITAGGYTASRKMILVK
jgi:hypothetical protein